MAKSKRLLVLCVDVDDDLGEKTGIKGPVIGKKACVEAGTKLALADPEDVDANSIFQAVKAFDELRELGHETEIAVVTGSARLGYEADANVVKQLERIVKDFQPEACVFVSDGASDERLVPLIQSRVKIDAVRAVTVKQTKEIEKTYFVILEKLKEPHFARIVFGIPGLALILFAFSELLGVRLFVGLLGAYLLFKGLGLEEQLFKRLSLSRYSFENVSFVFYFAAVPLAIVAVWLAVSRVVALEYAGESNVAKLVAWFLKDLLLLLPVSLLLIVAGNVLQALHDKKHHLLPRQIIYGSVVFLFWLVFNNAADWIIGSTSFANFFYLLILGVLAMYLVIYLSNEFRKGIVSRMKLEGKEAYTEIGGLIGKVVGLNKKKDAFVIQTTSGQKIDLDFNHIANVGEKIIIKY